MTYTPNDNSTVRGVLAAAVANSGTFTVAYPSGTTQSTFNAGLAGSPSIVINDNDTWTAAASKMSVTYGASDITVTNLSSTTWAAGSSFVLDLDRKDGNNVVILALPINLASVTGASGDVLTNFRPGVNGFIEHVSFAVTVPVTTASRATTLNLEINTTNLTGGTVALTSANCTPLGAIISNAADPSANNRITKADSLSVEHSSTTAFAEGAGVLYVRIRTDEV